MGHRAAGLAMGTPFGIPSHIPGLPAVPSTPQPLPPARCSPITSSVLVTGVERPPPKRPGRWVGSLGPRSNRSSKGVPALGGGGCRAAVVERHPAPGSHHNTFAWWQAATGSMHGGTTGPCLTKLPAPGRLTVEGVLLPPPLLRHVLPVLLLLLLRSLDLHVVAARPVG